MKLIQMGLIAILGLVFLIGCSGTGMMTAGHNGKMYWNPGNCSQYIYYNNDPDALRCLNNGQETGVVLRPADQQQVNNYYRQQETDQRALDSLKKSIQNMNYNNQMQQQNFQLQQMNNYLRYRY